MIPILYEANEKTFTTNGLGRLSDCMSCKVTEERNGRFDLEFEYPANGIHFEDITEGRIIAVTHDSTGDVQPFVIYGSDKPIDGVVTFRAYHLSYLLGQYPWSPTGSASSVYTLAEILANLESTASAPNSEPWDLSTDYTGNLTGFGWEDGKMLLRSVRAWLGGSEGSLLDRFHGEYKFDKWSVQLLKARGSNKGVKISYGKNLTDFKVETDISGAVTGVYGYYSGEYLVGSAKTSGTIVGVYGSGSDRLPGDRVGFQVVDFTDQIENGSEKTITAITTELRTLAQEYYEDNDLIDPAVSMDIDFVQLWETEEYKEYAPLLKCDLCDTVSVSFGTYGLRDAAVKIVAVEWDALADRYDKMTLGGLATTLAESINSGLSGSIQANADAIRDVANTLPSVLGLTSSYKTWSNIKAGTSVGTYVTLKTLDLAAGKWLIMMQNGNGQGSAISCNVRGRVTSGTATTAGGLGFSNDTSGNVAVGWFYVDASTAVTVTIDSYTYNTSVTNFNGGAAAIPLL